MNYYTVLGLITAMALIAAATLAANTPAEITAEVKVRDAPNLNGCEPGEKDEDVPDKCDGTIIQGTDDPPEEPDVD
jgi:hypothetical protein